MSLISLEGVSYAYPLADEGADPFAPATTEAQHKPRSVSALADIDLAIDPGTLTLLVGASGSGKSTLLRTMNGLVPKFHGGTLTGRVRVGGADLADVELHDVGRRSATIFQNPRTQFFTSFVRTELAFGLENYGVAPERIRDRVREAASDAGVTALLGRQIDTLSGGQAQRVSCACALVAGVDVLLFDEPTSNLSPAGIDDFRERLVALKETGHTLVVAEHRLYLFAGLADHVYRLEGGRIVEHLTGPEFFALDEDARRARGLRSFRREPVSLPAPPAADVNEPGLHVRDLRFSYGKGPRVIDLDRLDFPAGAVSILAGENGAGKSTLARLIAGLEKLPRGARIGIGKRASSARERNARVGMVMQDVRRQLFSESVRREVTLGIGGERAGEVDVDRLLARLDLADQVDRHPLALSGGQAQRLVVAATVAASKDVVIFDEPTSGVDLGHLTSIAALVRELADAGRTVIVITHDPELITCCGDYQVTLPTLEDTHDKKKDCISEVEA